MGLTIDNEVVGKNKKQESVKVVEDGLKEYDVFASRVCFSPDKEYWWEEFRVVGKLRAFNSISAMAAAKKRYPEICRVAVMASAHPQSPTSREAVAKAALQASKAINRFTNRT